MKVKKFVKMKVRGSQGTWKKTDFSVREDGVLLNTYGKNENSPIFVGQDFIDAGLPMPTLDLNYDDYSPEEQALALTIDSARVELSEESREAIEKWLSGEEDREKARMAKLNDRDNQNAFLRQHGYRWERKNYYASGPGELWTGWFLFDADGNEIIGEVEIGDQPVKTGRNLKALLTELGYYGDAEKTALEAKRERDAKRSEMRQKVRAFLDSTEGEKAVSDAKPFRISDINVSRNEFKVEPNAAIYHLVWNGSDGDNWSYNNDGMYISYRYPYDADVAAALEFLKGNSEDEDLEGANYAAYLDTTIDQV